MPNLFTSRAWDSDFFNRSIFTIDLDALRTKVENWPKNSLITVKVDAGKYQSLEHINNFNFSFVEGELAFQKKLLEMTQPASSTDFDAYLATGSSLDELKHIVSDLYIYSRFREPWFTAKERNSFYQRWIENSVYSKFDDCCLVLRSQGYISGFVTVRIQGLVATIGLIGVTTPFQGKGIGKQLLELVQNYSASKKAKIIKVATQTSNISAAKLYEKNGFSVTNISYWFYKQV